jgi:CheY-like chemotaxis protein
MRVLIADEDRAFNRIVLEHLSGTGFEVRAVYDATQAWTQIVATLPELLILDVKMPGGTGLEVLKKMKRLPRTAIIPVVVVTASDDPILLGMVRELEPDALLTKPLAMPLLDEQIARLLGSHKT